MSHVLNTAVMIFKLRLKEHLLNILLASEKLEAAEVLKILGRL